MKFHFVTKLPDGDVVLDDSRKWEGLPGDCMELIFGKKFKMEIWETCLSTMVEGEVASFKVKKRVSTLHCRSLCSDAFHFSDSPDR